MVEPFASLAIDRLILGVAEQDKNMNKTQTEIVVKKLKEDGQISRNWALNQRITRLASIILVLKKSGMEIEGKNYRTFGGYGRGLDYIYTKKLSPTK